METKHSIEDLALLGGSPAFGRKLHVGKPNMPDRRLLTKRFGRILDSGRLTNDGPMVREFEDRLREILGVRNCIAVSNGTVGLEIATRALGLTGEVIVPAFTFVATAHCLQWQGITPVFCDVDRSSACIDPSLVEALITDRTTGILAVHLWGRPCEVRRLRTVADRHGLDLVFDAAHAFGCTSGGRKIGGFGAAEVFSFHATKFLSTIEGGLISTNDDGLADRIRLMRNFGFRGMGNVIHIGTNGKMNEFCAAFGLVSLEGMDHVIERNRDNYMEYRKGLEPVPGFSLREYPAGEQCNYQYVISEVDPSCSVLSRDDFVELLRAENILVRKYFHPGCHRMEPYSSMYPNAADRLPVTEELASRVIAFPTGISTTAEDIRGVCALLEFVQDSADDIDRRIRAGISK